MGCNCNESTEVIEDLNGNPDKERCPACGHVYVDFRTETATQPADATDEHE